MLEEKAKELATQASNLIGGLARCWVAMLMYDVLGVYRLEGIEVEYPPRTHEDVWADALDASQQRRRQHIQDASQAGTGSVLQDETQPSAEMEHISLLPLLPPLHQLPASEREFFLMLDADLVTVNNFFRKQLTFFLDKFNIIQQQINALVTHTYTH